MIFWKSFRKFCSINQQNRKFDVDLRTGLIRATLLHVNRFGWNQKAIQAGCHDLNLSSASHGILRRGAYDVAEFIMQDWHLKTMIDFRQYSLEELQTRSRIFFAVKTRLSCQIPYINTWNEAIALGALPSNISSTTNTLWKLVDDIWFVSGDRSMDFNYFSKRTLLLGVFTSTELFMLTDKSKDFNETWKFLDRRLDDILDFGFNMRKMKSILTASTQGLKDMSTLLKPFPDKLENHIQDIRKQVSKKQND